MAQGFERDWMARLVVEKATQTAVFGPFCFAAAGINFTHRSNQMSRTAIFFCFLQYHHVV